MAGHLRRHLESEMLPQSSLVFNAVPQLRILRAIAPANFQRGRQPEDRRSDGCAGLARSPPPALRLPGVRAGTGCSWGSASISTFASLPTGSPSWGWGLDQEAGRLLPSASCKRTEFLFVVVQSLSRVRLFAIPRTAARQAPLSSAISWSLLRFMPIELMMPSNHPILCLPPRPDPHLLLLPSVFPSIRVFSNESVVGIRWPKYWSFSFSISPSSEYSGLISFRMDWLDLLEFLLLVGLLLALSPRVAALLACGVGDEGRTKTLPGICRALFSDSGTCLRPNQGCLLGSHSIPLMSTSWSPGTLSLSPVLLGHFLSNHQWSFAMGKPLILGKPALPR